MACWYRFDRAFDFVVKRGVEVAYPKGYVGLIPEAHAAAADATSAGGRVDRPETTNDEFARKHARPPSLRKQGRRR